MFYGTFPVDIATVQMLRAAQSGWKSPAKKREKYPLSRLPNIRSDPEYPSRRSETKFGANEYSVIRPAQSAHPIKLQKISSYYDITVSNKL